MNLAAPYDNFLSMTVSSLIDVLAERAKHLPDERQLAIVETLREMIDEPYRLSDDELSILQPALVDAEAGRNLVSLDEVDQRTRQLIATWSR